MEWFRHGAASFCGDVDRDEKGYIFKAVSISVICLLKRSMSAKIFILVGAVCVDFCEKVGGSVLGWVMVWVGVLVSVLDVVGGGIKVSWVIGVVDFVVVEVSATVGDGVGRGGRGGPLRWLGFGVCLSVTTWDC